MYGSALSLRIALMMCISHPISHWSQQQCAISLVVAAATLTRSGCNATMTSSHLSTPTRFHQTSCTPHAFQILSVLGCGCGTIVVVVKSLATIQVCLMVFSSLTDTTVTVGQSGAVICAQWFESHFVTIKGTMISRSCVSLDSAL